MKPIYSRTYLIQYLLCALSAQLIFASFFSQNLQWPFFPNLTATQNAGSFEYTLGPGFITGQEISLFLGYLFLYLSYEFYGIRSAWQTAVALPVATLSLALVPQILVPQLPEATTTHLMSTSATISFSIAITASLLVVFSVAGTLKTLTRQYLMFTRYIPALGLGFLTLVSIQKFAGGAFQKGVLQIYQEALPSLSHYLALTLAGLIPLYLLRTVLGLFKGRSKGHFQPTQGSKSQRSPHNEILDSANSEQEEGSISEIVLIEDRDIDTKAVAKALKKAKAPASWNIAQGKERDLITTSANDDDITLSEKVSLKY